jgi:hypothetical protein
MKNYVYLPLTPESMVAIGPYSVFLKFFLNIFPNPFVIWSINY